jgi:hypothetical protein
MNLMSKVEREVDAIRDVLYAKTKDMTAAQRTEYFHERCDQACKDYGFWQSDNGLLPRNGRAGV